VGTSERSLRVVRPGDLFGEQAPPGPPTQPPWPSSAQQSC
jgi:hypothetical protein